MICAKLEFSISGFEMKVDQIRRNTYFHPLRIAIAETVTAIVHSRDVFLGSEKRSGGIYM